MSNSKGKVLRRLTLYSEECRELLRQAVELLPEDQQTLNLKMATSMMGRFADSSSEGEQDNSGEDTSESEGETSENDAKTPESPAAATTITAGGGGGESKPQPGDKKQPQPKLNAKIDQRKHEFNIRQHIETVTCHAFPVQEPTNAELQIASSLLGKEELYLESERAVAQSFLDLATKLGKEEKRVLVIFLRSGRFAGAVFRGGKCTHHRTAQRYTVRKGQGKAQSVQDAQRKPKSMGAQLRRAGEEKLKDDVRETLEDWKDEIQNAGLVLISCPKTMTKSLYDSMEPIIARTDNRIRRVPLDLGRPTFENTVLIHDVLTVATLREPPVPTVGPVSNDNQPLEPVEEARKIKDTGKSPEPEPEVVPIIPLSPLHEAAQKGDLDTIRELLESSIREEGVDFRAGEDLMTPLHYAAGATSTGVDASAVSDAVLMLLVKGKSDPELVDARNRPPYFLASHEKVREAFRIARAKLGEDFCDWEAAKVGPPLTEDDIKERKEREAEKKKKKKARQKANKTKEREAQEEAAEKLRVQEEEVKNAAEAKRIRDGLELKKNNAANVCDFCQTVCKGRQRSQMFKRLEYAYCSTDCVNKHKRELIAAAAMARCGGT